MNQRRGTKKPQRLMVMGQLNLYITISYVVSLNVNDSLPSIM
ncbi:hypothetical protein VSP9026_01763 [Vibrio spartinae]|uniref:Uncharacterized protein n=1 Tax=Vibrio spartinae TaxID=1918945 RepID=A0A1N6M3S0_9VIBR|nr:hypothetical protein VSP9026_01763 [Vibrio spartinae]